MENAVERPALPNLVLLKQNPYQFAKIQREFNADLARSISCVLGAQIWTGFALHFAEMGKQRPLYHLWSLLSVPGGTTLNQTRVLTYLTAKCSSKDFKSIIIRMKYFNIKMFIKCITRMHHSTSIVIT